jgi:ABC-2 type transport system ATP-binding protein
MQGAQDRTNMLELQKVRVQFGPLIAVNDVNLKLHSGDLLGLVGPNGAGKTTLLRAAVGLQPLTCGIVRIMGQELQPDATEAFRWLGWASDNPPLYKDFTVRQFLRFIAKGYRLDQNNIDDKIDYWLRQLWLLSKADLKIKELSRGMWQRVGIVRTMLPEPKVVLLDEPAAGLDPAGRVEFRQFLCKLRDTGKAVIVSSHILADMPDYCTHLAIMDAGTIVEYDTIDKISAPHDGQRCQYNITLVHPVENAEKIIGGISGVENVNVEQENVTLKFSGDRAAAAELLTKLVENKLPVAAFTQDTQNLEDYYLSTGIKQVD